MFQYKKVLTSTKSLHCTILAVLFVSLSKIALNKFQLFRLNLHSWDGLMLKQDTVSLTGN